MLKINLSLPTINFLGIIIILLLIIECFSCVVKPLNNDSTLVKEKGSAYYDCKIPFHGECHRIYFFSIDQYRLGTGMSYAYEKSNVVTFNDDILMKGFISCTFCSQDSLLTELRLRTNKSVDTNIPFFIEVIKENFYDGRLKWNNDSLYYKGEVLKGRYKKTDKPCIYFESERCFCPF